MIRSSAVRRLLRPIAIILAIVFLLEAWLWDHLRPVVAAVVAIIPWERLKSEARVLVARMSPEASLAVFLIPVAILIPFKLLALWLIAHGAWWGAVGTVIFCKLFGLGVTAFAFDVCRDKLLELAWFCRVYGWVLAVRAWAHDLVDPITQHLQDLIHMIGRHKRPLVRFVSRIRTRMHRPQPVSPRF